MAASKENSEYGENPWAPHSSEERNSILGSQ